MDPAIATSQVRVAVIGDQSAADLALPVKAPIRVLIPRIRTILAGGRDDDETPVQFQSDGLRPYTLKLMAGVPFSLDATLETLGIPEGEALMLCQLPPGPPAPPVIEDIADAAAIHAAGQTKIFNPATMLAPTAVAAGLGVGAVISALALYGWLRGHTLWAQIAAAALALVFITATAVLERSGRGSAAGVLGLATVVPLGLALGLALPGHGVAPRLVLAGAGVAAWSMMLLVITNRWVAAHTAIAALCAAVALAATTRALWHLPFVTLGCGLLAISLLLAIQAPIVAPVLARFPFFYVPAPGEALVKPLSLAQIEALPRRAAAAQSFQAGLICASVILTAIGSVLVLWLPESPSLLCWWLVVAVGLITVLRMRLFDAATPSLWFLASPLLTAASLTAFFAGTGHLVAAAWAAAGVAGLAIPLVALAMIKPGELSIPRRGYLDIGENVLLWTIIPTMLWLIGLVSLIRNRGTL